MKKVKELSVIYDKIKSDLIHGGYNGEYLENHCLDATSIETCEFLKENPQELRQALIAFYFLGGSHEYQKLI